MKSKLNFSLKSLMILMILSLGFSSLSNALTIKEELNNAKKAKKTVFLIVTEKGVAVDKANKVSKEAIKLQKNTVILTMFRDDNANSDLVTKFGLSGAPLPIILVVASNGIVVGGLRDADANAEALVKLIPSPKYADVLQAINDKKSVFVVVSKKSFTDKYKIVENCKATLPQLKNNAVIVEVDADDLKEKAFLNQIGVNAVLTSSIVVVSNPQGQISGTYYSTTDVKTLADAALKVIKSGGCCPGGSSKGCAPAKK